MPSARSGAIRRTSAISSSSNPVAAAAMQQIKNANAPIVLDFTKKPPVSGGMASLGETTARKWGLPPDVRIWVYGHADQFGADGVQRVIKEIVSTITHEAKHVRMVQSINSSLYDEYFAHAREFILVNFRRPDAVERVKIWKTVVENYKNYPHANEVTGLKIQRPMTLPIPASNNPPN